MWIRRSEIIKKNRLSKNESTETKQSTRAKKKHENRYETVELRSKLFYWQSLLTTIICCFFFLLRQFEQFIRLEECFVFFQTKEKWKSSEKRYTHEISTIWYRPGIRRELKFPRMQWFFFILVVIVSFASNAQTAPAMVHKVKSSVHYLEMFDSMIVVCGKLYTVYNIEPHSYCVWSQRVSIRHKNIYLKVENDAQSLIKKFRFFITKFNSKRY